MGQKLPQEMELEKTSRWPMETNIYPGLQEDESTVGPIEVLPRSRWTPTNLVVPSKLAKG